VNDTTIFLSGVALAPILYSVALYSGAKVYRFIKYFQETMSLGAIGPFTLDSMQSNVRKRGGVLIGKGFALKSFGVLVVRRKAK
jgi:hypothetical protein